MSGDTCVMPDGNCSGCDHWCQGEAICVATDEYQKTCTLDCPGCDHCHEEEAFCDLDFVDDSDEPCTAGTPCVFCPFISSEAFRIFGPSLLDECSNKVREEMRRYLYRNVACEYRKGFADFSKMPNLPGWA